MFVRTFYPDRFLAHVYGTDPFLVYCEERGIPFEQIPGAAMRPWDSLRWTAALAQVPPEQRRQIEGELATVNDLANPEAIAHLLTTVAGRDILPGSIPGDAPLALWFLLHDPDAFHQVFLHHEILEPEVWRSIRGPPDITLEDVQGRAIALAAALRECFQRREGTGQFCTIDASPAGEAYGFVAHIADRPRLVDVFTEDGEHIHLLLRPGVPVHFVYLPHDGTILLKAHCRAADRVRELFRLFSRTVLRVELDHDSQEPFFTLDLLKHPFEPLPDAEDMRMVRIRALHLRYPERQGRRQVKLETVASDAVSAIARLMDAHVGDGILDEVEVCYAELQIVLNLDGGQKSYFIGLWPNRSTLNDTPLAERFRACLRRWGLCRAR